MKKRLFLLFLVCIFTNHSTLAQANLQIEVFDVAQSKVVQTFPLDKAKKDEALKLVKSIESLYPKLNPTPRTGSMVKVPFEPAINVNHELLKDPVKEVIFIFPIGERPYMLIFNKEKNNPMFYYFSQDSTSFQKQLNLTP
ncbi:hypothetical protein [Sutcliffiella deserti]|uniref:hypothetical protein n=1 Tax=Sutcliffiella deserti TaxID=2875501 RepID=UPI001CBCB428|nr:hypothetical protein [Sutcliffiella deserti]